VCIPRLVNYKSDIHQLLPPEPEDDPESECLVGRFCPFENRLGMYAVADELGYVFLNTAFKSDKWRESCKFQIFLRLVIYKPPILFFRYAIA